LYANRIEALHRERLGLQAAANDVRAEVKAGATPPDQAAPRLARINAEIANVRADIATTEAQAVAKGFSTTYLRAALRLRRMTPDERDHHDALMAMYREDLGIPVRAPAGGDRRCLP